MGKEEREARKAARKAKRLARWPDTDGVPYFVPKAKATLKSAAIAGVKFVVGLALEGGKAKHNAAVGHALSTLGAKGKAGDFVTNMVSEAVWDAFEDMEGDDD